MTSTGTLTTTPTAPIAAGVGTFSAVTHSTIGGPFKLTAALSTLTNPTVQSANFSLTASTQSDIILELAFTEPSNIPYASFTSSDVEVAQFTLRDGGGVADADGASTILNNITFTVANSAPLKTVALYDGATLLASVAGGPTVTFSNINGGAGIVASDGGTHDFNLHVTFFNTGPPIVDNTQFQFTITNATTTNQSSAFAAVNAGGSSSTIAIDQNRIEVVETKFVFTTAPSASIFAGDPFASQIVLEARDANDIRDLDYNAAVNVTNAGTSTMTDNAGHTSLTTISYNFAAGVLTFPTGFSYDNKGGGVGTLTIHDPALPNTTLTSSLITINVSNASNIIEDLAFSYPTNINFIPLQAATITGPGFANSIQMAQFKIQDGGGSADADGTATELTAITFSITNSSFLKELALFDGAGNKLGEVTVSGATATFGPFSAMAPDNASLGLKLYASFNTVIADNQKISFTITSATANPIRSIFSASDAGGAFTNVVAGAKNQMEVIASELDYTSFPSPANAELNVTFGPIVVEARDQYGNRDLDFTSNVTAFSNTGGATMINTPFAPDPILSFNNPSPGILTFPTGTTTGFQFTSTAAAGSVLHISAGATGDVPLGLNNFPSPPFNATASTLSTLNYVAGAFQTRIPYYNFQAAGPSVTVAQSSPLATFQVADGPDTDGAPTTLSSIKISISTNGVPGAPGIKEIALFNAAGVNVYETTLLSSTTVTFSPSPFISAPDNGTTTFTIRATFNNGAAQIHDLDNIQIQVLNVTQGAGSEFNQLVNSVTGGSWTKGTGAVTGGTQTANTVDLIDVVATKLVFTQNPPRYAGVGEQVPHFLSTITMVQAEDPNNLLDVDFDDHVTSTNSTKGNVTSSASVSGSPFSFASGKLDLSTLEYAAVGDGTLTVSPINVPAGVGAVTSAVSTLVDVIDVTTALATNGVTTSTNLAGGSVNKFIFGVTFHAPHVVTGPNHPLLQKFKILFNSANISTNPFINARVFEAASSPNFGGPNVTTLTGKVHLTVDSVTVFFDTPRDLSAGDKTYFLEVDVASGASGSTPNVTPYVLDNGFNAPDGSYTNIVVSQGSIHANTQGQAYSFASIFPPTLVSSYPASGQLDIDVNQPMLFLNFSVPVKSLDGVAKLVDPSTGTTFTLMTPDGIGNLVNPIRFALPGGLKPNNLYYITIAQGIATANTGLEDQAGNLFGGISYSGTLYFKTANPNPPLLLTTPPVGISAPSITNASLTSATINATFDQAGTAYYVVVPHNATAPTAAQLRNSSYPGAAAQGSFKISQTNPISQFGVMTPTSNFTATPYDVYLSAESYSEISGSSSTPYPPTVTTTPIPVTPPLPYGSSTQITKTGTITATTTSTSVTGSGTSFQTDLVPGRSLFDATSGNIIGTIASITNNTTLILTANANNAITGGAYKASGFEIGATGPTLQFTPTAAGAGISLNNPSISICTDSYQVLNSPIIISEGSTSDFTAAGAQTFNLVLPAGFQFDVTTNGTLTLTGNDFANSGSQPATPLKFIGGGILQVSFINTKNATLDNIIISGLRILSSSSTNGNITRLGGNGLPSLPDGTSFAALSSNDATGIQFTNNYTTSTFGNNQVTTIPDNFGGGSVILTPLPPLGDFGPSSFSGQGVNVNQLSLSAVTLSAPFNITITHTDNNGCISTTATQYTVYDHNTAIAILNSGNSNISGISQCIVNQNFPAAAATGGANLYKIKYDNLPAYYMTTLTADVPALARKIEFLTGQPQQLLDSAHWRPLIQGALLQLGPTDNSADGTVGHPLAAGFHESPNPLFNPHNPSNNPLPGIFSPPGVYYYDYQFDVSTILNAQSTIGINPYNYFKHTSPTQLNDYYTGGSLGVVELTGTFQSIANAAVQIPLIQNVEFFLPARPLVEVNLANRSANDILDASHPVGTFGPSDVGTNVFCEAGGQIAINGFPAASPGSSVGTFTVYDYSNPASPVAIYDKSIALTPAGFTDNGNGTATLDVITSGPNTGKLYIVNAYKNIQIVYTYKDNISPCQSSASLILRISPNPVSKFTFASPVNPATNPNTASANSFCVNNAITFDGTLSTISGSPVNSITKYAWDFGDVNSPKQSGSTPAGYTNVYGQSAKYLVTLNVTSNWGCPSVNNLTDTASVKVGHIPKVFFTFTGVSGLEHFTSTSTVAPSTIAGVTETIANNQWYYNYHTGVPGPTDNVGQFTYPPGLDSVNLVSTTGLGCSNSRIRTVLMLDAIPTLIDTATYQEDFESSNGKWQVYGSHNSTVKAVWSSRTAATWAWGTPDYSFKTKMQPLLLTDSALSTNPSNKVWMTSLDSTYRQDEHSGLYSPVFDISQLTRPMVSFNSFVDMGSDGVVLQYSTDNLNVADSLKQWTVLGYFLGGTSFSSGVDWYNAQSLGVSPGDQPLNPMGWSTRGGVGANWLESKQSLDTLFYPNPSPAPPVPPSRVVFRFALASSLTSAPGQGFAIDNFRLGNRTRTVLVENFKNVGDNNSEEKTQADALIAFNTSKIGTELIKINYDVGFPSIDPFNLDNPSDPSARALYYNVTTVPLARLDGANKAVAPFLPNAPGEAYFSSWGKFYYDQRSLQLAQANITIDNVSTTDSLSFRITVQPVVALGPNTILQVAILEDTVFANALPTSPTNKQSMVLSGETLFQYQLKKLLPSAAGTRFGQTYSPSSPPPAWKFSWTPDKTKFYGSPIGNISIVAFLQDFNTKEVWQTQAYRSVDLPGLTTGIEPIPSDQITFYPNPADQQLTIELPQATPTDLPVQFIDQVGRVVPAGTIAAGSKQKTVSTSSLTAGMYVIQLGTGTGTGTRTKIIVMHK
jgi:hypothetical protein